MATSTRKRLFARPLVRHYPHCTAKYPEKIKSEPPQHLVTERISSTEVVWQCVDCGAFVIVKERRT